MAERRAVLHSGLRQCRVFGLGGWLVVNGQLNLGQLVAAEIVLLANMTALTRFYFYLDSLYETIVAAWKVSELTEVDGEAVATPPMKSLPVVNGLTLKSALLAEPLTIKAGEVIVLRARRGGAAVFSCATSRHQTGTTRFRSPGTATSPSSAIGAST